MLVAIGLSHKTAPLDIREQVAVSDARTGEVLASFAADPDVVEAALLSTCNRTEVYLVTAGHAPVRLVAEALASEAAVPFGVVQPYLSTLTGEDAARHLLRVAAGLESMIIGEPQILGQVRRAFDSARRTGTAGPVLNRLMQVAVASGRRVRTETSLGRHASTVPHAAMQQARRALGGLDGRQLAIVGAGEMAELVARVFSQAGAKLTAVANRTVATAQALAGRYGARGIPLAALREAIAGTDILVVAVGAEHAVLGGADLTVQDVHAAPLLVIDLGVPRGVAPDARALSRLTVFDLDDLGPDGSVPPAADGVAQAAEITEDALEAYLRWLAGRAAVPVIAALHRRAERIIEAELHRARGRLRGLDESQRRAVRGVIEGVLRKMLHAPFVRLRADGDDAQSLTLARQLFDLDGDSEEPAP